MKDSTRRITQILGDACAYQSGPDSTLPPSLQALIDEELSSRQGRVTTRVRGSHIVITVRLRRWWATLLDWTPSDALLRRATELIYASEFWLKATVIGVVLYLAAEVGVAFLPGGPVEQIARGGR